MKTVTQNFKPAVQALGLLLLASACGKGYKAADTTGGLGAPVKPDGEGSSLLVAQVTEGDWCGTFAGSPLPTRYSFSADHTVTSTTGPKVSTNQWRAEDATYITLSNAQGELPRAIKRISDTELFVDLSKLPTGGSTGTFKPCPKVEPIDEPVTPDPVTPDPVTPDPVTPEPPTTTPPVVPANPTLLFPELNSFFRSSSWCADSAGNKTVIKFISEKEAKGKVTQGTSAPQTFNFKWAVQADKTIAIVDDTGKVTKADAFEKKSDTEILTKFTGDAVVLTACTVDP